MNLLFNEDRVKRIKGCKDENVQRLVEYIMKKAEDALLTEEISEDYADNSKVLKGNHAQHGNYYDASIPFHDNMPILGFAYHYTKDTRYFEKAKKLMLLYAGYKKWHGSSFFGKSELNNAHFNFGMACGYDIFYEELTAEERNTILTATYEKGIKVTIDEWVRPDMRIHAMDTMGHNWWVVCISMAGIAALVMKKDKPELIKDYEMAAEAIRTWFSYEGNLFNMKPCSLDKGSYYEGITYLDYTLREYGLFKIAAKRLMGEDIVNDDEILRLCSEFYCNTLYPNDGHTKAVYFGDAGKDLSGSAKCLLAAGAELPAMRWYLSKCNIKKDTLLDLIFYDEIYKDEKAAPPEKNICYNKIGWGIFRNSFDNNSTMLAVKCGDTWNHAHADAASFIYYADGEEIIGEGGTCDYGKKEYIDYFCSSDAHNTILFENKGQERRDIFNHTRLPGKLFSEYWKDEIKYVCADATGPMSRYLRRFLRHFVWLDKFILIYDDVESYEQGELQFLVHEKKDGYFKMLTSAFKETRTGYKDHRVDETEDYFAYTQKTDKECRAKFISILGKNSNKCSMSYENSTYTVSMGDWTVYINELSDGRIMHENCINNMGGWETDAILLAVSKNKIFFVNASLVRKDGKVIFNKLERTTDSVDL